VDEGRNPDIYTREMVELTRKSNQLLKGKMEAFASFRDALAHEMGTAMPELAEEIERVVVGTGGSSDVVVKEEKI
jgi:mediator of RNA polymerase II transcription subunit 10